MKLRRRIMPPSSPSPRRLRNNHVVSMEFNNAVVVSLQQVPCPKCIAHPNFSLMTCGTGYLLESSPHCYLARACHRERGDADVPVAYMPTLMVCYVC